MRVGVPRETEPGERRVAVTPETVKKLAKKGFEVVVEPGAGLGSDLEDRLYTEAGAILASAEEVWALPVVCKVAPPSVAEARLLARGATLVGHGWPGDHPDVVQVVAERGASWVAVEFVPRIARAQRMDVLSSMANLAGYKAVLDATSHYGRFLPMLMTAAGTVPPSHVLVIGAGVAGLSAIATAKRLGAVVRAFDTRKAVADQVKSLGARFLEMPDLEDAEDASGYAKGLSEAFIEKEMELLGKHTHECDIVVTTALIGGKTAPTLITEDMVKNMRRGSVIVDLAAPRGGNCELCVPGEVVERHGVTIIGYTNFPSRMARDASRLYARNLLSLLTHLKSKDDDTLSFDFDDEITRGVTLLHDGERVHAAVQET